MRDHDPDAVPTTRRAARLFAAVLAVPLLSGCTGAFFLTPAPPNPSGEAAGGVDVRVGDVAVDDLYLDAPQGVAAGGTAVLRAAIENDATAPDTLVSVSSPVATGARLQLDGRPVRSIALPPGQLIDVESRPGILLTGIRQQLRPGQWIPVTLRFARAGGATVAVTVGPLASADPGVMPPGGPGEHAGQAAVRP